jgi:hypothetical protein
MKYMLLIKFGDAPTPESPDKLERLFEVVPLLREARRATRAAAPSPAVVGPVP